MSAFIATLEALSKRYQNLLSFIILGTVVWFIAIEWNSLTTKVAVIEEKEIPKIHAEIADVRKDLHQLDNRVTRVETKVEQISEDVKEIKNEMKDMKKDMDGMKADIVEIKTILLKKNP